MSEETLSFQTEVAKLLRLMVNSVYSDKEIFLRELISNASDACDKARYLSITEPEILGDDPDFKVQINVDKEARTLSLSDNGIGMDRDGLISDLGTIARSGTSAFMDNLSGDQAEDMQMIGQFGVGFYSVFMIADKVEVTSRRAGDDAAWVWTSDGLGEFTINEGAREGRGTKIVIHLKEGEDEWLEEQRLQTVVKKYSDHIALPILLTIDDGEETAANEASAIWSRPKSEITDEQYTEFYHHVGHAMDDPWLNIHYKAEGKIEYTGLLFVPTRRPFDLFDPARRHAVKLYVRRVFITDEAEGLIPSYLRFLRGIVDSEDLPLNISREMLQNSPLIRHMNQAVTRRVLTELGKKAEKEPEKYAEFWENFGSVLKEGLYEDHERQADLLELVRFRSTAGEDLVSLKDYVARMKEGQEAIYYITGDDQQTLGTSPHLEGFRARGAEVLLLSDPVDDFWLSAVFEYEGHALTSATRGAADLSNLGQEPPKDETDEIEPAGDSELATLIALIKQTLGETVKDVRTTDRLTDSAVCLVADDGDMDMRLERMLKAHNQLNTDSVRILEINPKHGLIKNMAGAAAKGGAADDLADLAFLLLDQARIIEGEALPDAAAFSRRMATVMAKATG
ncbi:MAG: molecular chaperone HtpG [Alphaproteobacteria bacterium]|jgi:molecular chaperone HtpG|nr:molecular chaperone HtpG [Alphaproteobacteria bacterium]MDP6254553.1 molecular chaperone HtpG [Alphaproteobacteria bacterium]MDP7228261.1 molecular chaperone HtpG [Alphaproteobacteria bacterium]MDP7459766.1 molecular chaperone HtpG [Alphaproteobacteria bacterium]|tara:strand:- start:700 stop:2571 length:1872 start_codon:yes stop_codon:yes gene_type:complete